MNAQRWRVHFSSRLKGKALPPDAGAKHHSRIKLLVAAFCDAFVAVFAAFFDVSWGRLGALFGSVLVWSFLEPFGPLFCRPFWRTFVRKHAFFTIKVASEKNLTDKEREARVRIAKYNTNVQKLPC